MSKPNLFISYANKEHELCGGLLEQLKPFDDRGRFESVFVDRDSIEVGDEWDLKIKTALEETDIAVPLISPAFFASDYIRDDEIPDLVK